MNTFVVSPLGQHQIMQAFFAYPLWVFDLAKIVVMGFLHSILIVTETIKERKRLTTGIKVDYRDDFFYFLRTLVKRHIR